MYRSLGVVSDKIAQLSELPVQTGNVQGDVRGTVLEKTRNPRSVRVSVLRPSVGACVRALVRVWPRMRPECGLERRQTSLCAVFASKTSVFHENVARCARCLRPIVFSTLFSYRAGQRFRAGAS